MPGVILWDGVGLQAGAVASITERAGVAMDTVRDFGRLDVSGEGARDSRYGAAVALALAGARAELLPVDFLHPRLAPPKEKRVGRGGSYGAIAAFVVVTLAVAAWWDLHVMTTELATVNAEIEERAPRVKQAEELASKLKTAEGWYGQRPPVLDAIQHVTQAFPEEGIVWA